MTLGISSNAWLAITVAFMCTSWITSELSKISKAIAQLEKRGMDIEYKLHVMQHSIDSMAGSVDKVEENTRSLMNFPD